MADEKTDIIVAPPQEQEETKIDHGDMPTIHDILGHLIMTRGNESFYANMLSRLKIREDRRIPSIMGVSWEGNGYSLLYNPDYQATDVMTMQPAERLAYLKSVVAHEAMHILLNHIPRMARLASYLPTAKARTLFAPTVPDRSGKPTYTIQNIATDAAVNENLAPYFPNIGNPKEGWVLPATIGAPEKCTAEQYAELILSQTPAMTTQQLAQIIQDALERKKQKGQGKGQGQGQGQPGGNQPGQGKPQRGPGQGGFDVSHEGAHDDWASKLDEMTPEELESMAQTLEQESQRLVNEVARTCGNIPGAIQEILSRLDKAGEVPWHRLLKNQIVNKIQAKKKRSLQRSNRRSGSGGGCLYPGRVPEFNFRIKWGVDESGSMSDVDLAAGLVEMQNLIRQFPGVEVEVVEFDCKIDRIYTVNKKSEIKYDAMGRGGTSFDPFFEYVAEKGGADFVVIFTDGFAPAPQTRPRVPLIWCLTANGECPCPDYGRQIRISEG
jgi:predicted metal-dependent peptidase